VEIKSKEIAFLLVLGVLVSGLGLCSSLRGKSQPKVSSDGPQEILVHVAGDVHSPGIYQLPSGSRVFDAVAAAGGAGAEADIHRLNLAAFLSDGQKVVVPGANSGSSEEQEGLVNINTADQRTLESLPNIGPARAQSIIEYRNSSGGFSSLEQIMQVTGIGPSIFESIRDLITY